MKRILIPLFAAALAVGNFVEQTASAQNTWIGQNDVSATTNWSDTANWSFATPPTGLDTVFDDSGAASAAGVINSVVDTSGLDPSTLTFINQSQNGFYHTVLIPAGVGLNIAGNFTVGANSSINGYLTVVNFTGDGTLVQNGGNMTVQSIGSTSSSGARATLDLSGLSNFAYNGGLGTLTVAGSGGNARGGGTLILAGVSNYITAGNIEACTGTGNGGAGGLVELGAGTNILNVNSINVAGGKTSSATVQFAGPTGGLRIRGNGGTDVDRASFLIANRHNTGSGTPTGILDFTGGHPVDILADTLTLGQATSSNPSSSQGNTARFLFDAGIVDANTVHMAVNSQANINTTATLSVGGGKLIVETGGISLVNQTAGVGTGNLIVTNGGAIICSNDLVKTTTSGTGNVTIDNGTLNVSGILGSSAAPLNTFSISDATLYLPAAYSPNANVTALTCGGTTNRINITAIPVVSSYPTAIPVIQYAGALGGTFNIGVGALPASSPAYAGYLTNNAANSTIDLVVTAGPMPAREISWSGATDENWDTTTPNWRFNSSPTTYNELDFVRFDDAATRTAVNLTTTLHPSSVTVSNETKPYGFTGSGYLSGDTALIKDGASTLYITNSGINDFTGAVFINAGTVQVGEGTYYGNLSSGGITDNGLLRFNRADDVTLPNTISGSGSLSHIGMGTLIVSGANSYDGTTTVSSGTLRPASATALGSTNGGTIIASGATLDVNAQNLGAEPVTVSGDGLGAAGAIINSGAQSLNALRYVTLTGNTTFGGSGRWDIRGAPSTADPANAALSTGGHAYNLTKIGANQVSLVGATVDPMLGNVDVQQGIFGMETATTGLGDPTKTLTIEAGASLQFYQLTNELNKVIVLNSDGFTPSIINNSGANTILGPVSMLTDCYFNVNGTSLTLKGNLTGGQLTKNGTGALVLAGNSTHAGTTLNIGKLVLAGTHTGQITANFATSLAGTGVNNGFTDLTGALFPGDTNVAGTITLAGLTLEYGAEVFVDLGASTAVGGGTNDLVQVNGDLTINGNQITINPTGLLKLGVPYRLFNYTGSLIWNADLYIVGPNNYVFTINTNTVGQVNLVASGGPPIWNGASASDSLWSDSANWNGVTIQSGDTLYFAGETRLNNTNDTFAGNSFASLVFDATAGKFNLYGNPISLGTAIANNSTNTETINLGVSLSGNATFNGGPGMLIIGGGVTNAANLTTLTLGGHGILTNNLGTMSGLETNTLTMTDSNADWTFVDNGSGIPLDLPMAFDIQAGTFNFGAADNAPQLNSTAFINARLGVVANAPATFNMVNGSLTIAVRFNTGGAGDTISYFNQSGGTFTVLDVFQMADAAATAVSTVNVSGGTLVVGESESSPNSLFLCSRGTGTLNISGSGLVRCGTLDMSRNASSAGSTGTVNLNGGTLDVQRVSSGTSSTGTGGTPSATFYFNGGVLKARQSRTDFFRGRGASPAIPINTFLKAGGAMVDSAGFDVGIDEPLQHDSALGATADGGLTKLGAGALTLTAANTYTGPTAVGEGTLVVSGSLAASDVTVSNAAALAGAGTLGGNVTVEAGGSLSPANANAIGTLTVSGNVTLQGTSMFELNKTLSPAATNDQLVATGSISFGGTLTLVNLGPPLQVGDAFKLFTAGGGMSGSFTIDGPANVTWDTSTLTSDGTIRVLSALNQTPTNITAVVSGNQLQLSWPADHLGWRLQAQTNSVSTGLSGNWVDVPNSDSVTSMNFTIDPANGTVFFRMVYP